ncbi:hypothetical protein Btru_056210 [Bulinus truncatus]|nr:hypothetical protein Btru_056210 [Bulinus truncatus]
MKYVTDQSSLWEGEGTVYSKVPSIMRLFQAQPLSTETDHVTPDLDKKLRMLRQTNQLVKEKGLRVATPDRTAILELASNFEKRKLGKQQQILTDITKRCREQEIQDLSFKLTTKCDLQSTPRLTSDSSFYMNKRFNLDRTSELTPDSIMYAGTTISETLPQEKSYKFFPARAKYIQQNKLHGDQLHQFITDSGGFRQLAVEQLKSTETCRTGHPEKTLIKLTNRFRQMRGRYKNDNRRHSPLTSPKLLPGLNYLYLGLTDRGSYSTIAVQKPNSLSSVNHVDPGHTASDCDLGSEDFHQTIKHRCVSRDVHGVTQVPSMESIGRAFAQSFNK